MKSLVKTVALVLFLSFIMCLSGCFLTVTQNLKNGSSMLLSAYESLEKDYNKMSQATLICIKDNSEENIKKYQEAEKVFGDGFGAVGIAVRSMNSAIQALGTKKIKETP